MLRLLILLLRQRLHAGRPQPAAPAAGGAQPRRAASMLWAGGVALALGVAAYALPGPWRTARHDEPPPASAEKATLVLRVAGVESPPLLVYLERPGAQAAADPAALAVRVGSAASADLSNPANPAATAPPTLRLTSVGAVFEPAFQVAPLASRVEIGNADPVAHNTHLFDGRRRTLFNVALPQQGVAVTRVLGRSGLFEVRCDLHSWMRAAVFVPPNAHHLLVREAGEFVLSDIAPGRWRLHIWTPARGESVRWIELGPGAAQTLDIAAR